MKTFKRSLLAAVLGASALLAGACGGRESEDVAEIDPPVESLPAEEQQSADVEMETRSVEVDEVPASGEEDLPSEPTDPDASAERAELEARERQLRTRQADIEARERRLRELERERQARAEAPRREEPRAAPERPAREPEPEPAEEVEPAEPAEPAEDTEAEARPEPEPEPEARPAERDDWERARSASPTEPVTVPVGTAFDVEFMEGIASNTSRAGDTFRVRVAEDVTVDGRVAIPRGSEVTGVVSEAVPLRKVGGRARLNLKFTDLVLPSGSAVPIDASFVGQGRSETGKDAATIGGAAAGGAILGRVLNKGNRSRGSVIGAIIGAAAGAVIASKSAGEEVVIPEGTVVTLALDGEIDIRPRRQR